MNKELALKLNEVMNKMSELSHEEKVIPYMGWFWRELLDWEADALPLSREESHGFFWLDIAGKWDYEFVRVNAEYSRRILENMIQLGETFLTLVDLLKIENVRANDERPSRKVRSQNEM